MEAVDDGFAAIERKGALPSGDVTFLFTDIEGSTVRWDRFPEAMQLAVRRHDQIVSKAIEANAGTVFKTIGDAFCAVFHEATAAIAAVLDAQRSIAGADFSEVEGIRVRMALHSGTSDERDGDYFGPTLNRVARLLAIGHGGQVLVSGILAERVAGDLPDACALRDLGYHRLKDLSAAEHVFALQAGDLPHEFPKLRSLSVLHNNLPETLTPLFGREDDVGAVRTLLDGARLVTLLGAGGVGKTRCALQVAAEVVEAYMDGVWLVDLAPLRDAKSVAGAIATVFDIQESANRPLLETLVTQLKNKKMVLILDNCEHLLQSASEVAAAILRASPNVRILATSREHLGLPGEALYMLPSLSMPAPGLELDVESAMAFGSIALFVSRSNAVNQRFTLSADNLATVADIVRRLDGIPLAIELAAARVKLLAPRQIADKLNERFRLLTGGDRTAMPRHQTMRATIDWSYELLAAAERSLFRSLSIFAGTFSFASVCAVCSIEDFEEYEILDALGSLVDKSLVQVDHAGIEPRYRFLESTRQYAREKAAEAGEIGPLALRHALAYADFAEARAVDYETTPYPTWLGLVQPDLDNIRSALVWAFDAGGDDLIGKRLAATLARVMSASAAAEASRWVKVALSRAPDATPPETGARLHVAAAHLASALHQAKAALAASERALSLAKQSGSTRAIADAQRYAGRSLVYLGKPAEGEALLRSALDTFRELGVRRVGAVLRDLAAARAARGDAEDARAYYTLALETFKTFADEPNAAVTADSLALAGYRRGDLHSALRYSQEAVDAARRGSNRQHVPLFLSNMSMYAIALGHFDEARDQAREALKLAREIEADVIVTDIVQHITAIAALRPHENATMEKADRELAAKLLGFTDALCDAAGCDREFAEQAEYDIIERALAAALAQKLIPLRAEGARWIAWQGFAEALIV